MSRFIKGMDVERIPESLSTLKENDINYIRLSIWNDDCLTQEKDIEAAGCHKVEDAIAITKLANEANIRVVLNLYYCREKSNKWANLTIEELENATYDFSYQVIEAFKEAEARVSIIQIGSGLSKGIYYPEGNPTEFKNLAKFACAGIRACRDADPGVPLMIHLSDGCNNKTYRDWFDTYIDVGEDFEYIGLGYECSDEDTPRKLEHNLNDIALRYGKELIVVPANNIQTENVEDLLDRIKRVVGYNGAGVFFKEEQLFDEAGNPTELTQILKAF